MDVLLSLSMWLSTCLEQIHSWAHNLSTCLEQIHSQDLNVSNSKYAFHNVNKNKDDFITFL